LQPKYWGHIILNSQDYENHVHYTHFNPVKHGDMLSPSDWNFLSIHRFIDYGILNKNWAFDDDFRKFRFGE
jgi:putative transposase